ncbi:hypothetical protein [Dyadobacter bucti]|uniref:hypothetical protein n=1 Tax=Dyadobacter bucti TaxID=2572203 RepID=UPI0011083A77|nr:hypothetical protein [Dyadobacter bucti]
MKKFIEIFADEKRKAHVAPLTNEQLELVESVAKAYALSCIDPSEEEISHAWSDWYKENGGNNTQESWESAITWYKQKIGRK